MEGGAFGYHVMSSAIYPLQFDEEISNGKPNPENTFSTGLPGRRDFIIFTINTFVDLLTPQGMSRRNFYHRFLEYRRKFFSEFITETLI